jgi:hypothetical protein
MVEVCDINILLDYKSLCCHLTKMVVTQFYGFAIRRPNQVSRAVVARFCPSSAKERSSARMALVIHAGTLGSSLHLGTRALPISEADGPK